jgi:hypothetical protein
MKKAMLAAAARMARPPALNGAQPMRVSATTNAPANGPHGWTHDCVIRTNALPIRHELEVHFSRSLQSCGIKGTDGHPEATPREGGSYHNL